MTDQDEIARYEADERETVLAAFGHDDAWGIGVALRETAAAAGHGVAIDIRRPSGALLFRATLPGATMDQDDWLRRKAAVVNRFESSSALVAARMSAQGIDPYSMGWLSVTDFAVTGGAVPIRVTDAGIVAVLAVSGLTSEDDHALAVAALRAHAARA